ncbi:MAG: hypothetical protein ABSG39_12510 [Acidimicrobiales bacterium]
MTGTRLLGLPCQHQLALEMDRNAFPSRHHEGTTTKPCRASHSMV